MSYLTTRDGTNLYYEDWGTGRPVILLGTAMLNTRMWELQAPYLAERGYRCISYDRRGCGRSDRPWNGYGYDTLANDLADVMQTLDLHDVTLVGYAVGGGEAVQYLASYGDERTAQLVLAASTTPFMLQTADNPDGIEGAMFDAIAEVMTADRARWMAQLSGTFFGASESGEPMVSPEFAAWVTAMALDSSPRAALEIYRTLFTTDQRAETAKVSVPTLIIHGEADQGAPWALCGSKTAELLPAAQVLLYQGAAHGMFATHADRFNEDLWTFLRAGDGATSQGRASRKHETAA